MPHQIMATKGKGDLALGTGEWFLRGAGKTVFRINITYDPSITKVVFRDFRSGTGRVLCLNQRSLLQSSSNSFTT